MWLTDGRAWISNVVRIKAQGGVDNLLLESDLRTRPYNAVK
jgi:hypothetical protein